MKLNSIFLSLILLIFLPACLKTRAQLSGQDNSVVVQPERQPVDQGRFVSGTVNPQQRAQIDSRFYEIDKDFRQLYGKVENMENQLSQINTAPETAPKDDVKVKELEKRIATLEEAVLALDKKVGLKTKASKSSNVAAKKAKGFFTIGKDLVAKKEYEKAILVFEKYRTKYPRGKKYAAATYEIGQCFEKLKLPRDAKAFYQEIIERYPKTKMSARAQSKLKKIL